MKNTTHLVTVIIAFLACLPAMLEAAVEERETTIDGTPLVYKVVLPEGYDSSASYPALLLLGGGPQTMRTIDSILNRQFRRVAESRGYIVIAPAAPEGELFFQSGERIFPALLDEILENYPIEGQKFHIAGPSNGGIAAFHIAARNPGYFLSITAYPGHMWEATAEKLNAISELCVFAYIGENDTYRWHDKMQSEVEYLQELGTHARYSVEENQPHRLASLAGSNADRLFENFEFAEGGCRQ